MFRILTSTKFVAPAFLFLFPTLDSFAQTQTTGMLIEVNPCTLKQIPNNAFLRSSSSNAQKHMSLLFKDLGLPKTEATSQGIQIVYNAYQIFNEHLNEWITWNKYQRTSDWFYYPNPALPYDQNFFSKFSIPFNARIGNTPDLTPLEAPFTKQLYDALMNLILTPQIDMDSLMVPRRTLSLASGIKLTNLETLAQVCGYEDAFLDGLQYMGQSPFWFFSSPLYSGENTLLEITGLANRPDENLVDAQVEFHAAQGIRTTGRPTGTWITQYKSGYLGEIRNDSVKLLIEKLESNQTWLLVSSQTTSSSNGVIGSSIRAKATFPKGTVFRVRLVTDTRSFLPASTNPVNPSTHLFIMLKKASVFGSQCYPDLSNPGKCL